MKKKILFLFYVGLLFAATFFLPAFYQGKKSDGVVVKTYTASSGNQYNFYLPGKSKLRFTLQRPDSRDSSVLLCIAGAFTGDGKPDGIYGVDGNIYNRDSINYRLGGAIKIVKDSIEIFSTNKGKIFTPGFIDTLRMLKASFFQQIQMIVNGKAENSKSEKKFQCRGIAKLKGGGVAIVESKEEITLKTFAEDLAAEGSIQDLLYTDMGAWDEGWYRDKKGSLVITGNNRSQTDLQCNWVIFKKQ